MSPHSCKKEKKEEIEIDVKGLAMLDVQSMENLSKKLPIIYCQNFINSFFLTAEVDFEKIE
jgi:hypothetical protein